MVRQNRWFVKIGVTSNQWYVKIGGLVKILPKIPHWYQQDGKYWTSCNTAKKENSQIGKLQHYIHYHNVIVATHSSLHRGVERLCSRSTAVLSHIGGKVTVKYIIWHTQPEVCPWMFGITTRRICLQTAGWTTLAPVQLPTAPRSPSAAQRLHHLQSAEIRESMSILYLIKLVTSRLSSGSPLSWSPWFPSSAGSYMKWVKTNVIPCSSGILMSCLSCQHIKF